MLVSNGGVNGTIPLNVTATSMTLRVMQEIHHACKASSARMLSKLLLCVERPLGVLLNRRCPDKRHATTLKSIPEPSCLNPKPQTIGLLAFLGCWKAVASSWPAPCGALRRALGGLQGVCTGSIEGSWS